MDQNNPARFLDTAYNALKANPNATTQILQAAAQGQPVGLKGLAAAAAQQSQQEAQKAMAALQQQGPQPNIIQQMAHAGIMSQMNTGLPGAPMAPPAPPPQGMAGGGLVAFSGGGALSPDVIDAIQSHFAEGGDVRGYANGREVMSLFTDLVEDLPYGEMGSFIEGEAPVRKPPHPGYGEMGEFIKGAATKAEAPSSLEKLRQLLGKEISFPDIEAKIKGNVGSAVSKGVDTLVKYGKPIAPLLRAANPIFYAQGLSDVGEIITNPENQRMFTEDWRREMPSWLGGAPTPSSEGNLSDEDKMRLLLEDYPQSKAPKKAPEFPTPKVWMPETPEGQPDILPEPLVPKKGQKVAPEFKRVKQDTASSATNPENQGLGGVEQAKQMVDLIKELYGEQKMSPETAEKLAALQDQARTSTIIQTLMGGLAGGLSNPWGGRFALGSAALNALAGYQHGEKAESDLARNAFEIERAYADAPGKMQQMAAKQYVDLMSDKAKAQSTRDILEARLDRRDDLERWKEEQRLAHPEVHGAGAYSGVLNPVQQEQIINMRRDDARKEIDDQNKSRASEGLPQLTPEEKAAIYRRLGVPLDAAMLGAGVLGGGQLGASVQPQGRSLIGDKLIGSPPKQ